MRGQHVGNGQVTITPELHFQQRRAMAASLFWIAHMQPPGLDLKTSRLLMDCLICLSVKDFDGEDASSFDPRNNGNLGLLLAIMAFEGALPYDYNDTEGVPEAREHRDRIPSVELAELLGLSTRELADLMRWANVYPQSIRFPGGVTRGYRFEHVKAAWEKLWGHFEREVVAIELEKLERKRGGRDSNEWRRRDDMRRFLNGEWSWRDGWGYAGRTRALSR